jgi:hypothetical protein
MTKIIVVFLIWAKMLVLIASKVTLWLAYQFYAIASIQTHSSPHRT